MSVVWTIIILSILIFVHEFGHFIAARLNGVTVYDFSLGMGPSVLKYQGKRGTTYHLRALPIGGWCKMDGEDESSDNPGSFSQKKVWQRVSVILAGPVMNFILAMVFFIILYMIMGVPSTKSIIGEVIPNTPAQAAGLQTKDQVLAIDGTEVKTFQEMVTIVRANTGNQLDFSIKRGDQTLNIAVTPAPGQAGGSIGVYSGTEKANVFRSIGYGFKQTYEFTKLLIVSLYQMITGKIAPDVAGPVGMATIIGDAAQSGKNFGESLLRLMLLTAILSINLGFINLLPLPALDGSRVVFLAVEGIRGKAINPDREGLIHFIGFVLLLGLMVIITFNDISKLISS